MALRNVIQRRNHKERSQPGNRRKFGLLEKHKDYVERARDHHAKQEKLQRLQQKAALRNADEFNFGMIKSATNNLLDRARGGKHHQNRTGTNTLDLSNDLVAILKSQDLGYLRNVARIEEKRIEQIKDDIKPSIGSLSMKWLDEKEGRREALVRHGLIKLSKKSQRLSKRTLENGSIAQSGKKTIWVDSLEEAKSMSPMKQGEGKGKAKAKAYDEEFGSLAAMEQFASDKADFFPKESNDQAESRTTVNHAIVEKALGKLVSELISRQERLDALKEAQRKLETVRHLMTTKGTSARKLKSKEESLRDAVAKGARVTSNGLALPGPDDGGDDSDEGEINAYKQKSVWKWGKERKK